MEPDEAEAKKPAARLALIPLGPLGLEELHAYIGELQREICRAEAEITRKQAHRSSADAFFRKPESA